MPQKLILNFDYTEDTSVSGAVAEAVGGSLNNSDSSGTVSFASEKPLSSTACPTLKTANGSGCSSSGDVALLTYNNCNFGSSSALWNGYMRIDFSGTTALSCGTFPGPIVSDTLRRQAVDASKAASTLTRTAASGTKFTLDDTASGVDSNYQGDTFNGSGASGLSLMPMFNSGGGMEVTFDAGGKRSGVTMAVHLSGSNSAGTTLWDHTVAGTVNISETGSGASTVWTASTGTVTADACSGGITVYHNLVKMMGSTCMENVSYSAACCTPTSGTIVTTFKKSSQSPSNVITAAMNNKSESMTFTGCGTATYVNYQGTSSSVALNGCF